MVARGRRGGARGGNARTTVVTASPASTRNSTPNTQSNSRNPSTRKVVQVTTLDERFTQIKQTVQKKALAQAPSGISKPQVTTRRAAASAAAAASTPVVAAASSTSRGRGGNVVKTQTRGAQVTISSRGSGRGARGGRGAFATTRGRGGPHRGGRGGRGGRRGGRGGAGVSKEALDKDLEGFLHNSSTTELDDAILLHQPSNAKAKMEVDPYEL